MKKKTSQGGHGSEKTVIMVKIIYILTSQPWRYSVPWAFSPPSRPFMWWQNDSGACIIKDKWLGWMASPPINSERVSPAATTAAAMIAAAFGHVLPSLSCHSPHRHPHRHYPCHHWRQWHCQHCHVAVIVAGGIGQEIARMFAADKKQRGWCQTRGTT